MAWEGKSLGQICEQLKDQNRNGSRDLAALVKHVTTDTLVLLGLEPGARPRAGARARSARVRRADAGLGR